MTWLVWRQHRAQYLVGAALLAAFAVMIVVTGEQVSNQFHAAQVGCAAGHGTLRWLWRCRETSELPRRRATNAPTR